MSPNLEDFLQEKNKWAFDSVSFEHKGQMEPLLKKTALSRVNSRFLLASYRIKDILGGIAGFHITKHLLTVGLTPLMYS